VIMFFDGWCLWEPRYELSITQCEVDDTWFPFDEQTCQLIFISWLLTNDRLTLLPTTAYDDMTGHIKSPQWEILGK